MHLLDETVEECRDEALGCVVMWEGEENEVFVEVFVDVSLHLSAGVGGDGGIGVGEFERWCHKRMWEPPGCS